MKLSSIAFAVACVASSVGNLAAAVPLDISSGSVGFFSTPAPGPFSDVYTFTLPVATTLNGSVGSVISGNQDVDFTSIVLTGPTGPFSFSLVNPDPFEIWTLSTPLLAAGGYTLTITGTNSPGVATYTGNLAVAAIPEPGIAAMLLAGLGAVGFMSRRARRA